MPRMQKLFCQPGEHYWERELKKGPKPKACPEHGRSHINRPRGGIVAVTEDERRADYLIENGLATGGVARGEDERKLRFIQQQLRNGKADSPGMLMEVRRDIVRRYARHFTEASGV